ncbi:hypothetical protein AB5I39_08495 [Sphingomonas sp. MMS24-J45]|uniref:hypothetical protein n=1 Tax=Sphingomonas sp. MMS24-J45 TaxID=3238806 RepID=UPI003850518F
MTGSDQTDPTTAADRRVMKVARAEARARVWGIRRGGSGSMRDAFQQEIAATVRSASPFLISLVASQGKSVDGVVARIEPADRWPRWPSLHKNVRFRPARETHDQFEIWTASGWQPTVLLRGFGHRIAFLRSGDDWADLEIVNHSLEVEGQIGMVKFETLFGTLRVKLDDRLPETLAMACVGRPIGDVIDHASLRGRAWRVIEIDDSASPLAQTLVVATGSQPYVMPWAASRPRALFV